MLDVLTARGRETLEQEQRAAELFAARYPGSQYVSTPKDRPAAVDALILRAGVMRAACETKCRQMTLAQFEGFGREWLITFDKLVVAREFARAARVPLIGLLYLVPDDRILVAKLFDADGLPTSDFTIRTSTTQRTVNGGEATRANAYVRVTDAGYSPRANAKQSSEEWLSDYERAAA